MTIEITRGCECRILNKLNYLTENGSYNFVLQFSTKHAIEFRTTTQRNTAQRALSVIPECQMPNCHGA